jgi:hypothetical protein
MRPELDIQAAASRLAQLMMEEAMAPRITLQIMQMIFALIRSLFANKADLALEVLALRQQLAVYKRKQPRPRLNDLDRAFWTALKNQFADWADALVVVKPETVVRWQKQRFRKHWTHKSKPGRPTIDRQHIAFIKRISGEPTSLRPVVGASKAKPPRVRRGPHRPGVGTEVCYQALASHHPQVHVQALSAAGRPHDLAYLPEESG